MVIMAVDLGLKRTGVAVSDKGEGFAFPKGVVFEHNEERLIEKLDAMAKELKAELIVVGLPKNKTGIPLEMWDERCTTVLAHNALNATNTRGKKRKETVDAVAAVLILESYLEYRKNKK